MKLKTRSDYRVRRHQRVRRRISGTAARPRMALFKSNKALSVQFVDDTDGKTLAGVRTADGKGLAAAEALGRRAAEAALKLGIGVVVVDRGGFPFHGRIKAVVDAAVAAGLSIGDTGSKQDAEGAEAPAAGTEDA